MPRNYYMEMSEITLERRAGYEISEMLIWNGMNAIKNCDISKLYEKQATFHPDYPEDGVTYYSEEDVRRLMKNYGIEDYVKKVLNELENLEICD